MLHPALPQALPVTEDHVGDPPATRSSAPSRGCPYMSVVGLVRLCPMCRLIPTLSAAEASA